jgi:hypothetical protein
MGLFSSRKADSSGVIKMVMDEIAVSEKKIAKLDRRAAAARQKLEDLARERKSLVVRAYANDDSTALPEIHQNTNESLLTEMELSNVKAALEEETATLVRTRAELARLEADAEADADRDWFRRANKSSIAAAERFERAVQSLFTVFDQILEEGKNRDEILVKLKLRDASAFKFQYDDLGAAFGFLLRQVRIHYGVVPVDYSNSFSSFTAFIVNRCETFVKELAAREAAPKNSPGTDDDDPLNSGVMIPPDPGAGDDGSAAPAMVI